MKPCSRVVLIAVALAAVLLGRNATAEDRFPGAEWTHVPPAQAGWSAAGLAEVQDWSRHINSTAVMVIHHGVVVAEWGDTARRIELASVRKSF
jgi:hypothetical protein